MSWGGPVILEWVACGAPWIVGRLKGCLYAFLEGRAFDLKRRGEGLARWRSLALRGSEGQVGGWGRELCMGNRAWAERAEFWGLLRAAVPYVGAMARCLKKGRWCC